MISLVRASLRSLSTVNMPKFDLSGGSSVVLSQVPFANW